MAQVLCLLAVDDHLGMGDPDFGPGKIDHERSRRWQGPDSQDQVEVLVPTAPSAPSPSPEGDHWPKTGFKSCRIQQRCRPTISKADRDPNVVLTFPHGKFTQPSTSSSSVNVQREAVLVP